VNESTWRPASGSILGLFVHIATVSLPTLLTAPLDTRWWLEVAQPLLLTLTLAYAFGSYHILNHHSGPILR